MKKLITLALSAVAAFMISVPAIAQSGSVGHESSAGISGNLDVAGSKTPSTTGDMFSQLNNPNQFKDNDFRGVDLNRSPAGIGNQQAAADTRQDDVNRPPSLREKDHSSSFMDKDRSSSLGDKRGSLGSDNNQNALGMKQDSKFDQKSDKEKSDKDKLDKTSMDQSSTSEKVAANAPSDTSMYVWR